VAVIFRYKLYGASSGPVFDAGSEGGGIRIFTHMTYAFNDEQVCLFLLLFGFFSGIFLIDFDELAVWSL